MTTGYLLYGVLLAAIFYFLILRPQQKRQREMQAIMEALSEGDRVITAGGLHGTVVRVLDRTVVLRVYDNSELEFEKLSIVKITTDIPPLATDAYADEEAQEPSEKDTGGQD